MTRFDNPSVAIVGAGAMGCLFGGLLAEGGLDVTLIDVWKDHVDRINRDGLRVVGFGGDRHVRVRAVLDAREVREADIVFFQCKATANTAAANSVRHLFARLGTVGISFQNGLGSEEEIGGIVGLENMLMGLTAQSAMLDGPGAVRAFADLPSYIGELQGGVSERAAAIAAALSQAGLRVVASENILREKWAKLLVNIAFAGTSGTTGLTLGGVIEHPELCAVAKAAMDEAAAVALARGVSLDPAARLKTFDQILSGDARNNKASVCADLNAGRPTEVDYIYGTVIRAAAELGIAVPTLRALSALIKGREEAARTPASAAA